MVNFHCSLTTIKEWLYNLVKTLLRQFRWGFALAGFVALAMAAISWKLETSVNYWFWHRYYDITTLSSISFSVFCVSCLLFQNVLTAFGILQYTHPLSSFFVQKQIMGMLRISYLQVKTMH